MHGITRITEARHQRDPHARNPLRLKAGFARLVRESESRHHWNHDIEGVVGAAAVGDRIERDIEPGSHHVRIHNTLFWKTIYFDAKPGETVHFETVNYAGKGFLNLVLIIGVAPLFLAVERI